MIDKHELAEEWESLPDETKEMARQIIKSLAEKEMTVRDAREVFRACEIYMAVNSPVPPVVYMPK